MEEWMDLGGVECACPLGPSLEEMPVRTLRDKGIDAPTMAHVIEEIHTPFNLAFVTFTTGTTAFQNMTGITYEELASRREAGARALAAAGIKQGMHLLITYPLLVNLFTKELLDQQKIRVELLKRSNRDSFLEQLFSGRPDAVLGESAFLAGSLRTAKMLGMWEHIPGNLIVLAAGSPLDQELEPLVEDIPGGSLHDLYGCQEFGWIAVDGTPVRKDVLLAPVSKRLAVPVVGGLVVGDVLERAEKGHRLGSHGPLVTDSARRLSEPWETVIKKITAADVETARRTADSILRLKSRRVLVSEMLEIGGRETALAVRPCCCYGEEREEILVSGEKCGLFDELFRAQIEFQSRKKTDPVWRKREELC